MKPCFVSSMPVPHTQTARTSLKCAQRAPAVRMSADAGEKKETFSEWIFRKAMHNIDEGYGYEPFHKKAMDAREVEQEKAYSDQAKENKK